MAGWSYPRPVAMRHLDRIDARRIQRLRDRADMIDPVHVADGVHPVAEGDVLDI
jgi:hypothetical protein